MAMLIAHNDARNQRRGGERDFEVEHASIMQDAALEHSDRKGLIWRMAWDRWIDLAARKGMRSLGASGEEADRDVDECGLNFGPGHAAIATLVYGSLPQGASSSSRVDADAGADADACIDQNRSIVIRNIRLDVTSFGIPLGIPMIYQHASPGGHMPNIFLTIDRFAWQPRARACKKRHAAWGH